MEDVVGDDGAEADRQLGEGFVAGDGAQHRVGVEVDGVVQAGSCSLGSRGAGPGRRVELWFVAGTPCVAVA